MKAIKGGNLKSFFIENEIDCLITSASFEDRCFSVVNNIAGLELRNSIICRITDFNSTVISNSEKLKEKIASINTAIINLKIGDPTSSFIELVKSLGFLFENEPRSIVVDITTFTHEGLLIIYRILNNYKRKDDKIFLCYNGAEGYSCNEPDRNEKWLTKGVKDVRSIIGYPGYSDPSLKNHLIILFGFEKERTIRLIDEFEYDLVSLAFGAKSGSINSNHQEINEERHKQILSLYSNSKLFEVTLTNPEITKNEILKYVSKYKEYNIVLAPMNNKISTIGAGMAALENNNIQLCYLQANQYNTDGYSKASNDFYIWGMTI